MTDYSHVFDPWGRMLGYDTGKECLYGLTNVTNTRAFKYCEQIWGYPGPVLIAANSRVYHFDATKEMMRNFRRCRYFTHIAEAVYEKLRQPGVLNEDGTTRDGCREVVTNTGSCPDGSVSASETKVWAMVAAGMLILLCLAGSLLCYLGMACTWCFTRPKVEPELAK